MAEPATLKENIKAYEEMQSLMETEHWGKFAVFYDREFRGAFQDSQEAMRFALERWSLAPYLIRKVGQPTITHVPSAASVRPKAGNLGDSEMAEPATLNENIAEYEKMQALLEAEHWGEHVVFYDREFRGAFKEFHQAMRFALKELGGGPYLIREVGEPPFSMPVLIAPPSWNTQANAEV